MDQSLIAAEGKKDDATKSKSSSIVNSSGYLTK